MRLTRGSMPPIRLRGHVEHEIQLTVVLFVEPWPGDRPLRERDDSEPCARDQVYASVNACMHCATAAGSRSNDSRRAAHTANTVCNPVHSCHIVPRS